MTSDQDHDHDGRNDDEDGRCPFAFGDAANDFAGFVMTRIRFIIIVVVVVIIWTTIS
jgi:hypothetical protein